MCTRVMWPEARDAVLVGRNMDFHKDLMTNLWTAAPRRPTRRRGFGQAHLDLEVRQRRRRRLRHHLGGRTERGRSGRAHPVAGRIHLRPAGRLAHPARPGHLAAVLPGQLRHRRRGRRLDRGDRRAGGADGRPHRRCPPRTAPGPRRRDRGLGDHRVRRGPRPGVSLEGLHRDDQFTDLRSAAGTGQIIHRPGRRAAAAGLHSGQ